MGCRRGEGVFPCGFFFFPLACFAHCLLYVTYHDCPHSLVINPSEITTGLCGSHDAFSQMPSSALFGKRWCCQG